MKAYLFTYSLTCPQAQVHAVLNNTNAIHTWIAPFPYAAILVSNLTTQELLRDSPQSLVRHLVCDRATR